MNRISQSLASLAIVGLTGAAASAAVVVDGYNFDYAYTGDALPTTSSPVWTTVGAGSASVSGGVLTVDTTANDGKYFEIARPTEWDPTTISGEKAYVQFRMKVNSEVDGVRFAAQAYLGGAGGTIALNLGNFAGNTGVFNNLSALIAAVDVYEWHTYRVELDANAPSYRLWIDDFTYANDVSNGTGFGSGSSMYFGDGSGDTQGSIDLDYLAWTNAGIPSAIPEPTALSLLGLSTLALRRRR